MAGEDKGVHTFPKSINLKVNIIAGLEFKLAYYDIAVQYINHYKLATLVEGDPKASFSIATTPMSREGHYSIPWIAPLYPWSVPYNAEC